MLRLASYDIVFQEIPGEMTLALNLSGCPNGCLGCHSPHLQEDIGEPLNETLLVNLLDRYGSSVTCVCLMGGDADPKQVERLSLRICEITGGRLKTGWYSGRATLPKGFDVNSLDYLKLGPYVASCGGLDWPTTNQRFYKVESGKLSDVTYLFWKTSFVQGR